MQMIRNIAGIVLSLFGTSTFADPRCSVSNIQSIVPKNVTVHSVTALSAGSTYGQSFAENPEFPDPASVPEVCAVYVEIPSSPTSSYKFGLFLPNQTSWNSRFLMTGNGGFGGGVNVSIVNPFMRVRIA